MSAGRGSSRESGGAPSDSAKVLAEPCLKLIPRMLAAENKKFTYTGVDTDDDVREGRRTLRFLEWMVHTTK